MFFMSGTLFWGIIVILIGFLIFLKIFPAFKNLSVGRVVVGIILIIFGINIIIGEGFFTDRSMRFYRGMPDRPFFNDSVLKHDIIFSSKSIDLTNISGMGDTNLRINVAFGSAHIKINKHTRLIVNGNVAFGSADFPGNSKTFFGGINYSSPDSPERNTVINIKTNVAFGSLNVVEE
jgi:Cell wall-active antibiotics response 4TMS YvqF